MTATAATAAAAATGPSTTAQHALDDLRRAIVSGALAPGARIGQEDVAERLGISVAPVREALRILEREGQVTYRPRRGYVVTELKLADLREIYELRALLEARAARAALPRLTGADRGAIDDAQAACEHAVQQGDVVAELAANRRFHFAILEPAAQPHLLGLIGLLWDSTEAYRALYYSTAQERAASLDAHEQIIAALTASDADALIAALDEHRTRALRVLREILPGSA